MSTDFLAPYTGPWSPRLAAHLLRRAGFGGSAADVDRAAAAGMNVAVDRLINFGPDAYPAQPAGDITFPVGPKAALDQAAIKQRRLAFVRTEMWWLNRCLLTANPLQEKLVYFWHNHFTSGLGEGGIQPQDMVDQLNLFKQMATGNFAELTHAVTRNAAMLLYLNNAQNNKNHPNENYARELMELFTMGVGNYSEEDVRQSARAFTGFTLDYRGNRQFVFRPRIHDYGTKTFLGRSGDFDGDDIINIIMQQPVTARFMAAKFLKSFVYENPEPALLNAVADRFRATNYDVRDLVNVVLRSNAFYSDKAYRALVKSPIEVVIGAHKLLGATAVEPAALPALIQMGQSPLNPPNVAGWPGGALWLNTGTMMARLNYLNRLVLYKAQNGMTVASAGGAMAMSGQQNSGAMMAGPDAYKLAPAIAPPTDWVAGAKMQDPNDVANHVVAMSVQNDLTAQQLNTIVNYLSTDAVGNFVQLNGENFEEKVRGAMSLAMALPAYQLA